MIPLLPTDPAILSKLIEAGMSEYEARRKAKLFAECDAALGSTRLAGERIRLFVPGRVEFLGKHTDYAGGRSLLCAVERGLCLVASPREDHQLVLEDRTRDLHDAFAITAELASLPGEWSNYPRAVARRVARNFPGPLQGANVAFASDLPQSAGLSSSSMLVTGFFALLSAINGLPTHPSYSSAISSPETLAQYLGAIENGASFGGLEGDQGVGTMGGSQDHTAILLSQPGRLVQYAFAPVRREATLPFPRGHLLAIGGSGVIAEKTGNAREAYNRAARLVAAILRIWREYSGLPAETLMEAISQTPDAPDHIRDALEGAADPEFTPRELIDRLDHFVVESMLLIPQAAAALQSGDIETLGSVVDGSQSAGKRLLRNQVPETVTLARLARELGASAASAFGAGFGGSVWALIGEEKADEFLARWSVKYNEAFPERAAAASFFVTRAGPPLVQL